MTKKKSLLDWVRHMAAQPRPDRVRPNTVRLDGGWDYASESMAAALFPERLRSGPWKQTIRVPFCVESELSGIAQRPAPPVVWYRRTFDAPFPDAPRTLLHFGAADYRTTVWLNGKLLGRHEGGYTPFHFDITDALRPVGNELVVRVSDTFDPRIPRGKQSVTGRPFSIFYTPVTGLWQSVYMEPAGAAYVQDMNIMSDSHTGAVDLTLEIAGEAGSYRIAARAVGPDDAEAEVSVAFRKKDGGLMSVRARLNVPAPELWSPAHPNLYRLQISLIANRGAVHDELETYFGFRGLEINGTKLLLNDEPIYLKFLLKQGYFPGGHYTPERPEDFRTDVEMFQSMGFNGVRMHQKIESPQFLFWCDVLGFLVWEEMPSGFLFSDRLWNALRAQWAEAVRRDRNHPCIIAWVPFCESWGVHNILYSERARAFVREIAALTKQLDPTRPVVDNSGFEHVETDILDIHQYLGDAAKTRAYYESLRDPKNMEFTVLNLVQRFRVDDHPVSLLVPGIKYQGQPLVVSEYGGFGFYKTADRPLLDNFSDYTMAIAESDLFEGYCYTQAYDTELEKNGLLTLGREPKLPVKEIALINKKVDGIVAERRANQQAGANG